MIDSRGVGRYARRLVWVMLLGAGLCTAQKPVQIAGQQWWPDPDTGLMWTGDPAGLTPRQAVADAGCKTLTFDGYGGWHLPSKDEYEQATYIVDVPWIAAGGDDTGMLKPGRELKFATTGPDPNNSYWTSTPGTAPQDFWVMSYPGYPISKDAVSRIFLYPAMCVRPMEPELIALAKAVHPAYMVTGVTQLKAIGLLEQSEDALQAEQFAEAIEYAKQSLALEPISPRGLDDLGRAVTDTGQWDEAVKNLSAAVKLNNGPSLNFNLYYAKSEDDLKFVQELQRRAATDPNVKAAHLLTLRAMDAMGHAQFQEALDAANQLIKLEPKWGDGYQYLGQTYVRMERWDDAVSALETASKMDKDIKRTVKSDLKWAQKQQKTEQKS